MTPLHSSINSLDNQMSDSSEKWPSQFPRDTTDIGFQFTNTDDEENQHIFIIINLQQAPCVLHLDTA